MHPVEHGKHETTLSIGFDVGQVIIQEPEKSLYPKAELHRVQVLRAVQVKQPVISEHATHLDVVESGYVPVGHVIEQVFPDKKYPTVHELQNIAELEHVAHGAVQVGQIKLIVSE